MSCYYSVLVITVVINGLHCTKMVCHTPENLHKGISCTSGKSHAQCSNCTWYCTWLHKVKLRSHIMVCPIQENFSCTKAFIAQVAESRTQLNSTSCTMQHIVYSTQLHKVKLQVLHNEIVCPTQEGLFQLYKGISCKVESCAQLNYI